MNSSGNNEEKGLLWKLPVLNSRQLGKLGPGFGVGAGCGVGFGVGLIGGTGFGPGFPGLQLGFVLGAGCGVGLGFGYGVGRGIAHDEYRKYSNVGKLFNVPQYLPTQDEIGAIIDDFVVNTKKLIRATSKEVETILIEFAKFLLYKPVSTDSSIYFSSNSREMCVNEMQEFLCANICSCIYAMEFVYELHGYQYHEPSGESRSSVSLCPST